MTSTAAYLLYLVFALGGVGVYFLMPKAEASQTRAGAVIGLMAAAGLLIVLAAWVVVPGGTSGYFYVFSAIAVLAAARVITHPKPVYSALYLVLVVLAVAALLVMLHAEFLAVASIIIYAGAILVTYLFVIMLAHQGGSPIYDRRSREPFLSVLAGFVLMGAIAGRTCEAPSRPAAPAMRVGFESEAPSAGTRGEPLAPSRTDSPSPGNTAAIGSVVMTRYVVALEVAGVLLLVSMIGAIALSRQKVPVETFTPPRRPLGSVGREVEPF